MTTLYESAYAKLNLTLDVLGKREDGYHDLQSVMQAISLCDDIELDLGTGRDWCLKCDHSELPCDGRNLAWKAARVFCDGIGFDPQGLEIRITKRIPSQAGMGGGSADAAAVLRALNRHLGEPMSVLELADLGAQVGSDVPFCVLGGTAMAEGRGERLRKLPGLPECHIVVCKPEFSVSTPELFRTIDSVEISQHPDNGAMEQALSAGDLAAVAQNVYNVFDPVVAQLHPEMEQIKALFSQYGALAGQMTGSGSACFALFRDRESAGALYSRLKESYRDVFLCQRV